MNGILVIHKEKGYTSRDVVNILNKKFNMKRIGHAGTLDPMATGVLVVCLGRYTKLVGKLQCDEKEYIATIRWGIKTDTLDITGTVLETCEIKSVDNSLLIDTFHSFLGKSLQEVPMYAAVKVNGRKLYQYARKSEEVVPPKKEIEIKEIELLENRKEEVTFRCVVSKGTYIRSLIRDICTKLGVLGTMSNLTRTRQGQFTIDNALYLQDVDCSTSLLSVKDVFDYPIYLLNEEEYFKVKNGATLVIHRNDSFLIMEYQKEAVAIYQREDNFYKSYFML